MNFKNFGRVAPREREGVSDGYECQPPSLRGAFATKQSRIFFADLDCFAGARNDGDGNVRPIADRDSVCLARKTAIILKQR
jgi:hypothetical protein